jgi:hypothetical protein
VVDVSGAGVGLIVPLPAMPATRVVAMVSTADEVGDADGVEPSVASWRWTRCPTVVPSGSMSDVGVAAPRMTTRARWTTGEAPSRAVVVVVPLPRCPRRP